MKMTPFWKTVAAIVRKDLTAELRSREIVGAMGLFTLLSILIFSFALELNREAREAVVNGVLWVTLVYASLLGLNRSLASEREQANLDGMMIAPINRSAIYFGKMIGNLAFTVVVGLVLLPILTLLFNTQMIHPGLILILILGVLGFSSMGTLLAAMTVQTRARETLLPIAMLPSTLPIIMIVVRASTQILAGETLGAWFGGLLIIDIVYVVLGAVLFEFVTED